MATRSGRRYKVDPCIEKAWAGRGYAPFLSMLINNIIIDGSDAEHAPPFFIVRTLVERGGIAYVRSLKRWAAFVSEGVLRPSGIPRRVRLEGDRGVYSAPFDITAGADCDVCIISANAYRYPPLISICDKVETLRAVGDAMGQNMDALRECTLITYSDPALTGDIESAERARLNGARTVKLCTELGRQVELKTFSPAAQSHLVELLAVWTNTMEELDELTGRTRIGEKEERRTDDEVNEIRRAAFASVQGIIDNVNAWARWYGLDVHARAAGGERTSVQNIESEEPEGDGENVE